MKTRFIYFFNLLGDGNRNLGISGEDVVSLIGTPDKMLVDDKR